MLHDEELRGGNRRPPQMKNTDDVVKLSQQSKMSLNTPPSPLRHQAGGRSQPGQRRPPFCHYFNNNKVCPFEANCRFQHKESWICRDGVNCTRHMCQFRHQQSTGGNGGLNNQNYYWNGGGSNVANASTPTVNGGRTTQQLGENVPNSASSHLPTPVNNQQAWVQPQNQQLVVPNHSPFPPFPLFHPNPGFTLNPTHFHQENPLDHYYTNPFPINQMNGARPIEVGA